MKLNDETREALKQLVPLEELIKTQGTALAGVRQDKVVHVIPDSTKYLEEVRDFHTLGVPDDPRATLVQLTGRPEAFEALESEVRSELTEAILNCQWETAGGYPVTVDHVIAALRDYREKLFQ